MTGGAGYIGSHACKALAKAGFLPIVYDNLSMGHAYAVKWGPFIEADLNDREKLDAAFATFQPKAVLHFAANSIVSESIEHPGKYYQNNVGSAIALLEAMQRAGVKSFVFSSTCATYGHPDKIPMEEDHPQRPISPYGKSKWMVEQLLSDFEKAYGIRSAILRYFNAAGADLETEIGEHHTPETHLIPAVILAGLGGHQEVAVYGTDFPTKDGSAIRDYIHVQDLADAHVLALKWLLAGEKSVALNLGTGNGHSVLEIIDAVQKFCGKALSVRFEPKRMGDPSHLMANPQRAKALLGWTSQRSELNIIIESAWKWHHLLLENTPLLKSILCSSSLSS